MSTTDTVVSEERREVDAAHVKAMIEAVGHAGRNGVYHATTSSGDLTIYGPTAKALLTELLSRRTATPQSGGVVVKGLVKIITDAQDVLAEYIVPDSGVSDAECVNRLLGVLDNQDNVRFVRSTLADPILEAPADEEVEGVPCERCQGNGEIVTDWERYRRPRDGDVGDEAVASCPDCYGTGRAMEGLHFTADWLVRGMPVKTPGSNRRGRVASEVTFDGKVYVDYPAGGGAYWPATELQPWESHRDVLGRLVRDAWVKWARSQPNPKASWLVAYDDLPEADKEADRQIGEALTTAFPPVLNAALRRSTETDKPGVREALEALRPFAEAFAKADDPGVSDLYDEQPFSLHVNLGAWRRARSAWRKLAASLGLDALQPNLVADTDKFTQRTDIDGRQPEQNLNVAAAQIIDPVGGVEQPVNNVLRHDDEPPAIDGEQEYVDGFPISSPGGRV